MCVACVSRVGEAGGWSLSLLWDVGGVRLRERGGKVPDEYRRTREADAHAVILIYTALWHTFTITFHFLYATALYSRAAGDAHSHRAVHGEAGETLRDTHSCDTTAITGGAPRGSR